MNILEYHNQFKKTVIHLSFDNFGSNFIIDHLKAISGGAEFKEFKRAPGYNLRNIQFTFDAQDFRLGGFLSQIKKVFHPDLFKISEEKINKYSSTWEYYIELITYMDWHYDYSDDHRVWIIGNQKKDLIRAFTTELSKIDETKLDMISKNLFPEGKSYKNYIYQAHPAAAKATVDGTENL